MSVRRGEKGLLKQAAGVEPDDRTRIIHGDFREVLNEEIVPTDSVGLLLTDPMSGRGIQRHYDRESVQARA